MNGLAVYAAAGHSAGMADSWSGQVVGATATSVAVWGMVSVFAPDLKGWLIAGVALFLLWMFAYVLYLRYGRQHP